MQRKGLCSCDTEHMFDCPRGSAPGDNGDAVNAQDAMLDKMIDSLLGNDEVGGNLANLLIYLFIYLFIYLLNCAAASYK